MEGWHTTQRYNDVDQLTKMAARTRYLINEEPVTWAAVHRAIRLAQGILESGGTST